MVAFFFFQFGGELTDFIIVLHDRKAVKAFSSRMHLSLGAGLSAAAGPIGRAFEADVRASEKGSGLCYTYSCSKGNNKKTTSSHYYYPFQSMFIH
jgi:lipid-binding SYLF domain-containing protein